jgi:hypothetical protein
MGSKVGWHSVPSSLLASTRAAVLAFPPAAAVCASAVQEVVLDACVLPKAPLWTGVSQEVLRIATLLWGASERKLGKSL